MRPANATSLDAATTDHGKAASGNVVKKSADWIHWLLTTDFCPRWNELAYKIKEPLAILILTSLASLFGGIFVAPQGYILFAASLSVIAVGIVYPWFAVRGVACQIKFPSQRATEALTIHPSLVITNKWPIPVWGLAVQRGFLSVSDDTSDVDDTAVALAHIPGWSKTDFRWGFTPLHRGIYPKRPTMLTCAFPFGIWTARKTVEVSGNLIVNPISIPLTPNNCENFTLVHSRELTTSAGNEMDAMGIRPFRNGDALRDVHWSATARHDQLMVKERQSTRSDHAHIVLNLRNDSPPNDRLRNALDWSTRIAAGMCQANLDRQIPVTLDVGGKRIVIRDRRDQAVALATLAVAEFEEPSENEGATSRQACVDSQLRIAAYSVNSDDHGSVELTWKMAHASSTRILVDLPHSSIKTTSEFERDCQLVVAQLAGQIGAKKAASRQESVYA